MKSLYTLRYFPLILLFILASCSKGDPQAPQAETGLVKIGSGFAVGASAKIEVWAKSDLKTGFNRIYVAAFDSVSNNRLTDGHVSLNPKMEMNMNGMVMSHSAPFENPESHLAVNELFPAAVVFTMPSSGESGKWFMEVSFHNHANNRSGKAVVPVTVTDHQDARLIFATSVIDNSKYVISLISPEKPTVGVNDFELLVHKKIDGNTYPASEDLVVTIDPQMPDMGHGSPNNVNPIHVSKGHYKGKVNFTMTGFWKVNLTLKTATGQLLSNEAFFNINL